MVINYIGLDFIKLLKGHLAAGKIRKVTKEFS